MSAPDVHIILAEKVFDEDLSAFDRKDFMLGTLLPDIRYLAGIDRYQTHFKDLKLTDLSGDSSFMAGAKFHSIVDEARMAYLETHDVYPWLPKSQYIHSALKFLEDEVLHDRLTDKGRFPGWFASLPYEQIDFPVDRQCLDRWYPLLLEYLEAPPSKGRIEKLVLGMGFKREEVKELHDVIGKIRGLPEYAKIVLDFYDNF